MQWRTPGGGRTVPGAWGWAGRQVFNSGVLLIDVAAFNAQDVLERCLAFGEATRRSGSGSTRI